MTSCIGCVYFVQMSEGYDAEGRSIYKSWCQVGKRCSEDNSCWKAPRCDIDIINELTIDKKHELMSAVKDISESANELLARVTDLGFDAREPFKCQSYTVKELRRIMSEMKYLYDGIDRTTTEDWWWRKREYNVKMKIGLDITVDAFNEREAIDAAKELIDTDILTGFVKDSYSNIEVTEVKGGDDDSIFQGN